MKSLWSNYQCKLLQEMDIFFRSLVKTKLRVHAKNIILNQHFPMKF